MCHGVNGMARGMVVLLEFIELHQTNDVYIQFYIDLSHCDCTYNTMIL